MLDNRSMLLVGKLMPWPSTLGDNRSLTQTEVALHQITHSQGESGSLAARIRWVIEPYRYSLAPSIPAMLIREMMAGERHWRG